VEGAGTSFDRLRVSTNAKSPLSVTRGRASLFLGWDTGRDIEDNWLLSHRAQYHCHTSSFFEEPSEPMDALGHAKHDRNEFQQFHSPRIISLY
jgi:hypothetical protein